MRLRYACASVGPSPLTTYLEIAVKVPNIVGIFHYHLPPELEGLVCPGHLVEAPFGKQSVQGVVLRFISEPHVPQTRPVTRLIDSEAALTSAQIALAIELSETSLAPLADCIDLMLPPGLSKMADTLYELVEPEPVLSNTAKDISPLAGRILKFLEKRGALRGRQIDQLMPKVEWNNAARTLVRKGLVRARAVLPPPTVQPKYVRTAQLACTPEEAEAMLSKLGRAGSAALERRQAIVRFLIKEIGPVDVSWIYAASGGNLADLRLLADKDLVRLGESEAWRDPLADMEYVPSEAPPLTREQQAAWAEIRAGLHTLARNEETLPYLLHGVTGSGKTEVYLQAVAETIRLNRQAIILVPEIALTPQTIRRFVSRFPGRVGLAHYRLSTGERYDTWRRARAGLIPVVVGPRSALFTPFPRLGLIVVDECHDDTYYQADTTPHYHASQAAVDYARLAGAVCVLGSATPDIASRYFSEPRKEPGNSKTRLHYLNLPARILAHKQAVDHQVKKYGLAPRYHTLSDQAETMDLPPVHVVDMRHELKAGNTTIFSRLLQKALGEALERNQQAILFLNRRGTATFVFCRDCGHALKCPECDLPLTSHVRKSGQKPLIPVQPPMVDAGAYDLICHSCAYQRRMPSACPECSSNRIRQYGTGTERVVEEVQRLFPEARTLRWDYETTRQKGSHEIILSHFANQRADILVGTQMIAKGLDLPLVTLVGAVLADVGLNLPDFRASERTFQVLTQVAGRAGRSPLGGQVVLQTFQPDHYVIQAAARHDYGSFYTKELEYRRQLGYPPFTKLVRLEYRHADMNKAQEAALSMAARIKGWIQSEGRIATDLIGPAPCFFARQAGIFRWQIILRGPDPASLIKGRETNGWRVEVNPASLL
jgi:primosomal protein N' (replication factor Y) (superfamily II helicase)